MPTLKITTTRKFQDKLTLDNYLRDVCKLEAPERRKLIKVGKMTFVSSWLDTDYEVKD